MTDDETPGGYDSLEGMKERAAALGNPIVPSYIERATDRIVERDDGYAIEAPDVDPNNAEMLFHFGVLAGAALEREFPAPSRTTDGRADDLWIPWAEDTSLLEEGDLDRAHIRAYLDECITFWRDSDEEFAEYYVDCFQSVRVSMLGELLPEEVDRDD